MGLTAPGSALAGALGFLTRLPVGREDADWAAFRVTPAALPVAGYVVGGLLALAVAVPTAIGLPPAVVAAGLLAWTYLLTGVAHVDGLADLADGVVVHGDAERRLAVMADTTVGVGALLAVGVVVVGLALAILALVDLALAAGATHPVRRGVLLAAGVVLAVEVGAKFGMAVLATLGTAAHDGMGAELADSAAPASLALPALVALPAAAVTWPSPAAAAGLLAAVGTALLLLAWSRHRLGGVTGDVFGAANELGRVVGLHAGVIAWTLS